MSEVDSAFASVCLRLHTERKNGRDTLPTCEVEPGLWMTLMIFTDESGPSLSTLHAEPIR